MMCTTKFSLGAALLMTVLAFTKPSDAGPQAGPPPLANAELLDADNLGEIKRLYRELIDAENRHDIEAVRRLVWVSPSVLFVAKTATPAEGNWAGFWGTEIVLQHLDDLYNAGPFRIDPDYDKEKVVALARDVVQTYVPVSVTVAYARANSGPEALPHDPGMGAHSARMAHGDRHSATDSTSAPLLRHQR
jgi:hypothetical protein